MMWTLFPLLVFAASPQDTDDAPLSDTELLIDRTLSTANLRPDARGLLANPSGPVLELDGVRLSIDHRRTELSGLREGTSNISLESALGRGYFRVPRSGSIATTEVEAEFGLSENTTIRIQVPFETRRVSYETFAGDIERHTAQGLADVRVSGSIEMSYRDKERAEFTLGLRLPTGTTRATERNMGGAPGSQRLPYAQQLGGGTFAALPGFLWTHWGRHWSYGAGVHGEFPFGDGDQGWSFSESVGARLWTSRRIDRFRAIVVGLDAWHTGKLDGSDPALTSAFDPSEDPTNYGGTRVYLDAGLHMEVERSHHLAIEMGIPLYQDTNGLQLDQDYRFQVGWWFTF